MESLPVDANTLPLGNTTNTRQTLAAFIYRNTKETFQTKL